MRLATEDHTIDLAHPVVMGVLNVTPDSFSDGGQYVEAVAAIRRGLEMERAGAAIVDIGGESTRPGAQPVSAADEIQRILPVIEELSRQLTVPISVDTSKPEVMKAAVQAGASIINDVCALQADHALRTAAELGVPICLMHMRGEPRTMQKAPSYEDVVEDVNRYLCERVDACLGAGIDHEKLVIDPGFGFGKTLTHNLAMMDRLERFTDAGLPLLVGVSRKSMLGAVMERSEAERLNGALALTAIAVYKGANIIRTHDVGPTLEAIRMAEAVKTGR
jgi:dihydropteroate synthase